MSKKPASVAPGGLRSNMSTEREIGRVQARMNAFEKDLDEIKADVRQIRDVVISVKGGWRTILLMASVSAAIGALGAKLATLLGLFSK